MHSPMRRWLSPQRCAWQILVTVVPATTHPAIDHIFHLAIEPLDSGRVGALVLDGVDSPELPGWGGGEPFRSCGLRRRVE